MINLSLVLAFLMIAGIVSYLRYVGPLLRKKGLDYYEEVSLALMITGYAFRDEKIKDIAEVALIVVRGLERLSLTSEEKHEEAIEILSKKLLDEFNLQLEEGALDLLIQIAVTMLPATNVDE